MFIKLLNHQIFIVYMFINFAKLGPSANCSVNYTSNFKLACFALLFMHISLRWYLEMNTNDWFNLAWILSCICFFVIFFSSFKWFLLDNRNP